MKSALTALLLILSINAYAITGFLRSSDVSGNQRNCHYSNGVTITIPSSSMCPISID